VRDNAWSFGEFGEGFISCFKGQEDGCRFERRDGEHFSADFEDEIVAPLNLLVA